MNPVIMDPPATPKTLLITGATGNQGGAVIDALLKLPSPFVRTIFAVTRDAWSPAAQRLAARSDKIKLVEGDLDDVPKLFRAAARANRGRPIYGVYSVQVSRGPGVTPENEVKQGKDLVDEAIATGVRHFVYSSVERGGDEASWSNPTPVEHFQPKHEIERHLRIQAAADRSQHKMTWTILRPVAFMENLEADFKTKVFLTALSNHLAPDKKMQWVSTKDIGVFAAMAFFQTGKWKGRAVGIAGDEMTTGELFDVIGRATGAGWPTTFWPLGSVLTYMVKEVGLMIRWFASDGYKADVAARRSEHPGLMTVDQWLRAGGGGFVKPVQA